MGGFFLSSRKARARYAASIHWGKSDVSQKYLDLQLAKLAEQIVALSKTDEKPTADQACQLLQLLLDAAYWASLEHDPPRGGTSLPPAKGENQ